MSRKNRLNQAETAVATMTVEEAPVNAALEGDLAHVKGELTAVFTGLQRRADMIGGDADVMAARVRAELNGAVAEKPELGDAVQRAVEARWGTLNMFAPGASADLVVQAMRKDLMAAATTATTKDVPAASPARTQTSVEATATAVDENPGLTRLMGYIDRLQAPAEAAAGLRRDIGGLGKQLKDPHVVRTAKKAILKVAKRHAGNDALISELQ